MWKPDAVVPENRWRARVIWAGLLVSIAAYTVWQLWKIYDGYNNISTSLEVTDELYEFPHLTVCFSPNQGCDEDTDCAASALANSNVALGEDSYEVASISSLDERCVGFDLASLNLKDKDMAPEDVQLVVSASWIVSQSAATDRGFFNHVIVLTSDGEPTLENISDLYVPFLRIIPSSEAVLTQTVAELTIGKTTKEALDGSVKTTYPPLVLSSTEYVDDNPLSEVAEDDFAYGILVILLTQGAFSNTSVKEITWEGAKVVNRFRMPSRPLLHKSIPLDLAGFFGNIGGFWELLIVFWGLFFIATREERAPKLKARDFAKTVQTGKEILRRRSLSVDSPPVSASRGEERPQWESAYQGTNPAADADAGGTAAAAAAGSPAMPPVSGGSAGTRRTPTTTSSSGGGTSNGNHRQENGASSSSNGSGRYRRPVVQDKPRRGSGSGSRPPAGQAPAPPSYAAMSAV